MQVSLSSSTGSAASSAAASDIAKLQKQLMALVDELKGVATSDMDAKAKKEKVKLLQAQISAIQRARQQAQQEVQSRKAEAASAQRRTTERQTASPGSQLDTFA